MMKTYRNDIRTKFHWRSMFLIVRTLGYPTTLIIIAIDTNHNRFRLSIRRRIILYLLLGR
jgi:hypothetical protein